MSTYRDSKNLLPLTIRLNLHLKLHINTSQFEERSDNLRLFHQTNNKVQLFISLQSSAINEASVSLIIARHVVSVISLHHIDKYLCMNFFEFIKTRVFVRHFLISVALTALAITLVLVALKWYTHHGESMVVPSLTGLTPEQIDQLETTSDLEIIVTDSVFDSKLPRGSVIIQDPVAGSKVKRNRKVYLTTVSVMPEKVAMPNLVDLTLRQASATLETYGLQLGKVTYVPDIAANAVLAQFYKSREIDPDFEILKGSVIDLRVGESFGGGRYKLPFLIGKTRQEALDLLNNNLLTLGEEKYEDDADPETARVYSQNPSYSPQRMMNVGQPVSLVFKDPFTFDFEIYLQEFANDTIIPEDDETDYEF